ncbi:MAG TPA: lipopolysaccharide heptosyltransferase II, partial [Bryobacteraceae bacterium]|nr:lipopolysaccharide heptosyltransferase II [Bryobacteraceae bacterium]
MGDAVMCLPALRAIRDRFPQAKISILAKSSVSDLYTHESFTDDLIIYNSNSYFRVGSDLRRRQFDCAILLQNAFEAAWIAWLARIPTRIGYNTDLRGLLLTRAIKVPKPGEIPRHQRFYYVELLRRAGVIDHLPTCDGIRLTRSATRTRTIGVSPGAAFGNAKRWLPERFAEAASQLANARGASIALFGSAAERALCDRVAQLIHGPQVTNYAGQTTLAQFIERAAQCELFLTNDSGAMHIASALGVPIVAIFGATDHIATGPTGSNSRVVREPVECSPCLLRECPID